METGCDPTPTAALDTLELSIPTTVASATTIEELTIDGTTVTGQPAEILSVVQSAIDTHDPDVLICSTAELIPTLYEMATTAGLEAFTLSRWPDIDYQQLASQSTYASYGQVGHSPARYNVPGRAIIDASNTFFYRETNLEGVLDLVSRTCLPRDRFRQSLVVAARLVS